MEKKKIQTYNREQQSWFFTRLNIDKPCGGPENVSLRSAIWSTTD